MVVHLAEAAAIQETYTALQARQLAVRLQQLQIAGTTANQTRYRAIANRCLRILKGEICTYCFSRLLTITQVVNRNVAVSHQLVSADIAVHYNI